MATGLYAGTGLATLYDIAQTLGQTNALMQNVVELQAQTNEIWQALPFKPCNKNTTELVQLRTALPDVAFRMINRGSQPTKSSVSQASFTTGGIEALAQIDERIMEINKGSNEYRMNENRAHQESISKKMCQTIFYGDEKINPASFTGLSAFFYSKANQDPIYADQIIDAGGTGDNLTSLWIVTFAPDTVYGIHPENIPGGYKYKDNGRVSVNDEKGGKYYAYESQFNWDMGLCIRDPRYVVRLANIDITNTESTTFRNKMIEAYNQIHNVDHGRTFIMCNRKVQTYLAIMATNSKNVDLRFDEFAGKKVTHFWTSPILMNDAILGTESQLV